MDFGKAIKTRKQGQELCFVCPKCHKLKLEFNTKKKVYHCFRCGFSGKDKKTFVSSELTALDKKSRLKWPRPKFSSFLTAQSVNYLLHRGLDSKRIKQLRAYSSKEPKYHNYVILPIWEKGKAVCFVARSVLPNVSPKELSPPGDQSNRSCYLHNIDEVKRNRPVVLVEGIFDCETVRSVGLYPCVASFGSSLSDTQAGKLMAKRPSAIIVFYDNDAAGQEGAIRVFRKLIRRGYGPAFILSLTNGFKDPADASPAVIKKLLTSIPL